MSYYSNIEFSIPSPALSDGTIPRFPTVGYFYGNSSESPSVNIAEYARIKSPAGESTGRDIYSFLMLKGVVFKDDEGTPCSGFQCKFCLDEVYSSLISSTTPVKSSDSYAYRAFPIVTSDSNNILISYVIRANGSIRLQLALNGTLFKPLSVKGTYLFV